MSRNEAIASPIRIFARAVLAASIFTPLGVHAQEPEIPLDSLVRTTPSGQYADPAFFFRFHGYTTVSFAQVGTGLGQEVGATPHILLNGPSGRTGDNGSGFRNDAALFVGGEPFDGVGAVIEMHFVGNSLDPVLTEAKFTYELAASTNHRMSLSGGRFWWPFGAHNNEWFSSLNNFPILSPAAAEVVPAHYNEVGFLVDGVSRLAAGWGINYAGAVGNGVPGFELMQNVRSTASDEDGDRSLTGRVALVRGGAVGLEMGLSAAGGGLRRGVDPTISADDPNRYPASFSAIGADLSVSTGKLGLTGYYYRSSEDLVGAPLGELSRDGFTLESSLRFPISNNARVQGVSLVARVGRADEDSLGGDVYGRVQLGGGLALHLTRSFEARFGYVVQKEKLDLPGVSNDVLSFSVTAEF